MNIIQMVLTLIRATRKTTLNCMPALSVRLVPNAHCKQLQQLRTIGTHEDNERYFLSFGLPAKPGIAKNFIEANDIDRKAVAGFIDSLLAKKSVFYNPIKCYKLVKFCGL